MEKIKIETGHAPKAIGPYSQAIKSGEMVFCSGQIPLIPETGELVKGNIEEQTHQVMRNIRAVLEAAGLGFDNIVKTTIFLKNFDDFKRVNDTYAQYLTEPFPARSTVEVARLPLDVGIEIEVIAKAK
jgi:2-iminobutanoate/2-iminopropanoate deaminase